jgi:putative tRNA adenosine deaminase-associated protein
VPYFAAVFAQTETGWVGTEAELAELSVVDDVADLMREAAVETAGDPVILLVEQDDEWFAVVRLDGEDDPRAFLSDGRAGRISELGRLLAEFIGAGEESSDEAPDGDPSLLQDLGIEAERLSDLSERALPGDALLTVAEKAGFAEEFDRLRD